MVPDFTLLSFGHGLPGDGCERQQCKIRYLVALAALTLALGSFGCRDSAYSAAAREGTIDSLRAFIAKHPKDDNVPAARARLAELAFAQARSVHSVVGYKRFLEEFPEEQPSHSARALLEGLRFNTAKDKNTPQAWRQFLHDHPSGTHVEQASATLHELELKQVLVPGTSAASMEKALAGSAEDAQSTEVRARLDEQAFKEAGGPRGWFRYLRAFPAGKHRDEARTGLLDAQLEGLLISGQIDAAAELAKRSPLVAGLPGWSARLKSEAKMLELFQVREPRVQQALPDYYRRSFEELKDSMGSFDPRERWEAAIELGYHVDVRVIDVLLDAIKNGRNDKVRRHAADSLRQVLKLLPPHVAQYEVFSRLENSQPLASDARLVVGQGILFESLGLAEEARFEYQKAFDPKLMDPLLLSRGAALRLSRQEFHSAAVAARLLALWAKETVEENLAPEDVSLTAARTVCAAADATRQATEIFAQLKSKPAEFPREVEAFERQVAGTAALVEAKLRDIELKRLEADTAFKTCFAEGATERLAAADQKRLDAMAKLPAAWSGKVRRYAQLRDPSWVVRERAATESTGR